MFKLINYISLFLLFLIISQVSFASVSYDTVSATVTSQKYWYSTYIGSSTIYLDAQAACDAYGAAIISLRGSDYSLISATLSNISTYSAYCTITKLYIPTNTTSASDTNWLYSSSSSYDVYSCSSGYFLSDAQGNPSSSGQYCTTGIDSCESKSGQTELLWTSKDNPQYTACYGGCAVSTNVIGTTGADENKVYIQATYTYTGETVDCVEGSDTSTPESTASAANAAAAEAARLAAIDQAIADAKSACGGEGHYTTGTFNGSTIVTCKDTGAQTTVNDTSTTTTVTNPDGTTTTTTTTVSNSSTSSNNNLSTTIDSNGGSSTSGGSSSNTTGTTTTSVTRDAAGNIISSTTSGSSDTSGDGGYPDGSASFNYSETARDERTFTSILSTHYDELQQTQLFGSVSGFFDVSFSGSCSPIVVPFFDSDTLFDICSILDSFSTWITAIVLFVCSLFAFRVVME